MNATATMTPADAQTAADAQHMRALQRANEVRLARAELKRSVGQGIIDVAEVILNCPWEAESMAVADLLTSQRRWGHTRVRRFLATIPISETKTIGSMTERQRVELVRTLAVAHGTARAPQRANVTASAVGLHATVAG
jgi:hypothetical protein